MRGGTNLKTYLSLILYLLLVSIGLAYGADATEAKISSPLNESVVSRVVDVEIASKDIPAGQDLWICVYPLDVKRYYFLDKRYSPLLRTIRGNLSTQALVGTDLDSDQEFELLTVVADRNAIVAIMEYLDRSNEMGDWPGLERLPNGSEIYDTIKVTRK